MKQLSRSNRRRVSRAFIAVMTIIVVTALSVVSYADETVGGTCLATGSETVATDRPEYQPGDTVVMNGSGYAGDCDVVVRVTRPDGTIVVGDGTFQPGSDTVSIPTDGTLVYNYELNGITGTYLVDVVGAEGAVLASTTFDDPSVQLHKDSAFAAQGYVFRRGDTVYARFDTGLTSGSQYVTFQVLDPSATPVQTSGCLLASSFASSKPTDSFTIDATDPLSASSSWTYKMVRYGNDSTCTTAVGGGTFTTAFYVAQAFAFADQAKRDACVADPCSDLKSAFGLGQTAWVKVLGFRPSLTDNNTRWIKPTGALCDNSADGDRPDSDASGGLGTGYRPNDVGEAANTTGGAAQCGAIAAGQQGVWTLRLSPTAAGTANHQVDLTAFTVDLVTPTVTIIKPLPAQNQTVTPSDTDVDVTWDADEAGTYSVRVGGSSCSTGTQVDSGTYPASGDAVLDDVVTTIDATDLAYGANTIRVCVTDGAGNTGSATTTIYRQAPTFLLYNGGQIVNAGTSLPLGAKLTSSSSACAVGDNKIAFYLDRNPITGATGPYLLAESIKTNNSGQATTSTATTSWQEGVYEVTAVFTGTTTCAASSDTATLTVAQPGNAATGGGWYTLNGSGRVNFGFTVRKVQGTTNEYKGQIVLINNGKWRLKGALTSFSKTNTTPPNGAANGTGDLYVWSSGVNDWVLSEAGVTFTASFTDNGQGGKNSYDKFGIHINHVVVSGEPALPNSATILLKGGNVTIFR